MRKKHRTASALLGCLEITLFMPVGVERFRTSGKALAHSFIIPVIVALISGLALLSVHSQSELSGISSEFVFFVAISRAFVCLAVFLGVMYLIAQKLDKGEYFKRFVIINNWLCIPQLLMVLPILGLYHAGIHEWKSIQALLILTALYSYAYSAFMITHAFRIPWELAGSMAILSLAINETSMDALQWVTAQAL